MCASFPRQNFHSPLRFPSLFLSSLESLSVLFWWTKLGKRVALWFALTRPHSNDWRNRKTQKFLQSCKRCSANFAINRINRNDKRFFLPCEKNAVDNLFVKDISFVVSTNLRLKSFQLIPISVRLPWFQCTMSKEYESRARWISGAWVWGQLSLSSSIRQQDLHL